MYGRANDANASNFQVQGVFAPNGGMPPATTAPNFNSGGSSGSSGGGRSSGRRGGEGGGEAERLPGAEVLDLFILMSRQQIDLDSTGAASRLYPTGFGFATF